MKRGELLAMIAAVLLCAAVTVAADELRLKDGTVIVGTIVGFEDNSFRVRTGYGFALVRKEMVVEIVIRAEPPAPTPQQANPTQAAPPQPATEPPPALPVSAIEKTPAQAESQKVATAPAPAPNPPKNQLPGATPAAEAAAPKSAASTPSPPPKSEPKPPESMRFDVDGTSYTNHTFGFRLYKPPGWRVVEGAHERLPNAIVAMATPDERAFVVVSRQPLAGSLEEHVHRVARELQRRYENFRSLGEERVDISGTRAVVRRFRALVEDHDWSGQVAWVARGEEVFTLFGLTRAETELVQIHENIISRVITSLAFSGR